MAGRSSGHGRRRRRAPARAPHSFRRSSAYRGARSQPARLGQHLIASPERAGSWVDSLGIGPDDLVVEIGPGTGALTEPISRRAGAVLALEADGELARRLATSCGPQVEVVHADALRHPLPEVPYRVVANLPFNRTGALLRRFLQEPASPLLRLDLIVQWQVARARARASSGPPSDLVGISWGPWWRFERGQRFPASCFAPVPSVDAAALHVRRRVPPLLEPGAARSFERLVRAAFSSSNLGTGLARVAGRRRAAAACSASSADPGSPPSMVSPPAWVSLFEQLAR